MARLFSGSGQYLSTASGITYPLTMAAWCRVPALPTSAQIAQAILCVSNNSATNDFHRLKLVAAGAVQVDSYRSTGASALTSTTVSTNTWFHAAAVVASATSRAAYLDGGGKGTNATSKIPSGINSTEIGTLLAGSAYFLFAGQIAEAAVWSVALTDAEITALASGVPPWQVRPESIWGYWPILGLASPEPNYGGVAARAMALTGAPTLADGPSVGLWMPPVREPALIDLAANAVPPTYVAAGASNATTGTAIAPEYPAGIAAGDLFVLHCVGQGQTTNLPTVDAPSGWSTLYSSEGATNQCKQWLFARDARAVGTESGTVTVACTTPGTNGVVAGVIYAVRGVPPGATFFEGASLATGLSASIAVPSVAAGHARLCCAFIGVGGNQTPPELTGEINGDWVIRNTTSGATGDGYCLQLQTATAWNQTISGGTAAITSDDWVVRAFALKSYNALVADSLSGAVPSLGAPTAKPALVGTPLVSRAPLLGVPAIGQKHALATAGLADAAPVPGHPALDSLGSLGAASLAGTAPTVGQPTISQAHALAVTALSTQPALAQPVVGQVHALTAASLSAQPALTSPALGQEHALAATSLATTPALAQPVMVVKRNLVAMSLADAAPTLGQSTLAQRHVLSATSLADRAPTLGQPIPATLGAITALPLISGDPVLDAPALSQAHVLAATALATAAPVLAHPTIGQEGVLAPTSLEAAAPAATSPTVGQRHVFAADALATTAPSLDQTALAQAQHLVATALAGTAFILEQPGVATSVHGLAANDLGARAPALDVPGVGQEHALTANAQGATAPTLGVPAIESFLPGTFVATDLDAAAVVLGSPKINWRELGMIRFRAANTQAKVDTYGARPAYASAGAGVSSAAQLSALAPLAPADVQAGDVLLWVAAAIDSDPSSNVAVPAGYVALTGSPFGTNASSYAPRLHVGLKAATGAEAGQPQSFSYALASGDAARRSISARVFRVSAADGFAATLVEGVAVSEGVTAGAANITCPPVAPAGVNRLGLIVTVLDDDTGDVNSAGGIWQQAAPEHKNTTGGDCTIDLQWASLAREPSTGTQIPYGAIGDIWISVGFAIAPRRISIDVASASVLIEDLAPVLATAVNM